MLFQASHACFGLVGVCVPAPTCSCRASGSESTGPRLKPGIMSSSTSPGLVVLVVALVVVLAVVLLLVVVLVALQPAIMSSSTSPAVVLFVLVVLVVLLLVLAAFVLLVLVALKVEGGCRDLLVPASVEFASGELPSSCSSGPGRDATGGVRSRVLSSTLHAH